MAVSKWIGGIIIFIAFIIAGKTQACDNFAFQATGIDTQPSSEIRQSF